MKEEDIGHGELQILAGPCMRTLRQEGDNNVRMIVCWLASLQDLSCVVYMSMCL